MLKNPKESPSFKCFGAETVQISRFHFDLRRSRRAVFETTNFDLTDEARFLKLGRKQDPD